MSSTGLRLPMDDLSTVARGNVLVLDDDPAVAATLEAQVAVRPVSSTAAALKALEGGTFDVVVVDLDHGPGMGDFVRQVAERFPCVSRILLTGDPAVVASPDDARTLVLVKPVEPVDLRSWTTNGIAMTRLARAKLQFRGA